MQNKVDRIILAFTLQNSPLKPIKSGSSVIKGTINDHRFQYISRQFHGASTSKAAGNRSPKLMVCQESNIGLLDDAAWIWTSNDFRREGQGTF